LHPVEAGEVPKDRPGGEVLRESTRKRDAATAEKTFAALAHGPIGEAYNHLQYSIQDEVDVHRVVLSWRAWAILDLAGKENAHTLLRQSVRFCTHEGRGSGTVGNVVAKLLDEHKLLSREPGDRKADDAWIEHLADTIYGGSREKAADATAAALAEGFSPEHVG